MYTFFIENHVLLQNTESNQNVILIINYYPLTLKKEKTLLCWSKTLFKEGNHYTSTLTDKRL